MSANAENAAAGKYESTADVSLVANNVVGVDAEAQESTVDFGETPYDAGDVVTVTIEGTLFTHAVVYGNTAADISAALAGKITGSDSVYTATVNEDGQLLITTENAGIPFEVETNVVDVAYFDNAAPEHETTDAVTAVAQQATIALDTENAYDIGDIISGKINDVEFSHTVATGESLQDIAGALAQSITDQSVNVVVSGDGAIITITANTPGQSFTLTDVAVAEFEGTENELTIVETDNVEAQAQVTEFTLGGAPDAGDTFSITINGVTYTATAALNSTAETVLADLASQIPADSAVTAAVADGKLVVTAKDAGTSFEFGESVVNATPAANSTSSDTPVIAERSDRLYRASQYGQV